MIWFTAEEDIRLQRFVMEDLKAEVAMNTACTEIVNMVMEDDGLRKKAAGRIDKKLGKELLIEPSRRGPYKCPQCPKVYLTKWVLEEHIAGEHPLEVVVN